MNDILSRLTDDVQWAIVREISLDHRRFDCGDRPLGFTHADDHVYPIHDSECEGPNSSRHC